MIYLTWIYFEERDRKIASSFHVGAAAALFRRHRPKADNLILTPVETVMTTDPSNKPNIILLTLDEMRFPSEFPKGVNSPAEFLAKFMPYTYRMLWERGVKFSNYQAAAADCTPSRGTMATGLYAQQTWLMLTRASM